MKTWKPLLVAVFACSFSCANLAHSAAPKSVDFVVSPAVGYAPLNVKVRITVPPHVDNRYFCLAYDSGAFGASTCRDHGPTAPVSTWIDLKALPEGEYRILVELHRTSDVIITPSQQVKVLAAFPQ